MKSIGKNLCLIVIVCCTISITTVTSETFMLKQNHRDDDLKNLGVDLFFGTDVGNISVHYNSTKPSFDSDIFKLNSSNAITAMAKGKNHLVVRKEDGSIYACPFDFYRTSYRCTDKPIKLKIDAVEGLSMAVVGSGVYFVGEDGSEGHCEVNNGACFKFNSDNKYTGIAANETSIEFYISLSSGELSHCPTTKPTDKQCKIVHKHDPWFNQGLTAVHVENNTVWLGTKKGRLLKCLWTQNKDKLKCDKFLEIEWKFFSNHPIVSSISSKNGQLFAHIEDKKFNKILRCSVNDSKKCTTFKLPENSRSFLIV